MHFILAPQSVELQLPAAASKMAALQAEEERRDTRSAHLEKKCNYWWRETPYAWLALEGLLIIFSQRYLANCRITDELSCSRKAQGRVTRSSRLPRSLWECSTVTGSIAGFGVGAVHTCMSVFILFLDMVTMHASINDPFRSFPLDRNNCSMVNNPFGL